MIWKIGIKNYKTSSLKLKHNDQLKLESKIFPKKKKEKKGEHSYARCIVQNHLTLSGEILFPTASKPHRSSFA